MKKLFLGLAVMLVAVVLFACNKPNGGNTTPDEPTPTITTASIETVLTTYKNNQEAQVEGVVYGVMSNGFYLADSETGCIFVTKSAASGTAVNVGDKVKVKAQFGYTSNFPQLKSVTEVTVLSSGNALVNKVEEVAFNTIKALDYTAKTGAYGKRVKLVGTLSLKSGFYRLTDEDGVAVQFYTGSKVSELADYIDSRVTLEAIVHNYSFSENAWQLSFVGTKADITNTPLPFSYLLGKAKEQIDAELATSIYGKIVLPKTNPSFASLVYTWSVDANDYISIADNVATIINPAADQNITLKVNVSNGAESADLEYPIVLHAIVNKTVTEFNQDLPVVNLSNVIVTGVVISISRNQSLSLRTLVLQDPATKETTTVDFSNSGSYIKIGDPEFAAIKYGDEITVTGLYRSKASGDRPTISGVSSVVINSSGNAYEQDLEHAIVVDDWNKLSDEWVNYTGKLIKFENPYLIYSTNGEPGETSFVRMSDVATPNQTYGEGVNKRWLSLLIGAHNETLGGSSWHKYFNIPFSSAEAAQQFGVTIYGYCLYVSDTIVQFVMADPSCFVLQPIDAAKMAITTSMPLSMTGGSVVNLMTTHSAIDGVIAWTSSDTDLYDPTTGAVKDVEDNTSVTLTAAFTVGGKPYEMTFEMPILKNVPLTVSEVMALANATEVKMTGIVVAFTSDGNTQEQRKGIAVAGADGKIIFLDGVGALYGKTYPNYVDSKGDAIKVGDEVLIKGIFYSSTPAISDGPVQTSRLRVEVSTGLITILSSGNALPLDKANAIIVDDTADMEALVADIDAVPYGQLIKIVATKDHPLYAGGSSSSAPFNVKLYMKTATDNNGTKYNTRTFTLKSDVAAAMLGDDWLSEYLLIDGPFVGPSGTNPSLVYTGTFYMMIAYSTKSYYQCQVVSADDFDLLPSLDIVKSKVFGSIPTSLDSEATSIALPATSKFTGAISWSSSDPSVINVATGAVTTPASDTVVTLTASFTFGGENVEHTIDVTVLAGAAVAVNVSDVLALTEAGSVYVQGVIAGFGSAISASSSLAEGNNLGIVLKDLTTNDLIFVINVGTLVGATYPAYTDQNGTALAIGSTIELKGALAISGTRYTINVAEGELLAKGTQAVTFDDSKAIQVTQDSDLEALVANTSTIPFMKLIKVTVTSENPLFVGGSSATLSKCNLKFWMKKGAKAKADAQYNGKLFAFPLPANAANAGGSATWWENAFHFTSGFVAPSSTNSGLELTGSMYFVIVNSSSDYWYSAPINYTNWSLVAAA